ncbi:MAG TPA: porin family protein, partial [Flavobacterium sp.]
MKKLILSAAALFAFGFANAQDAATTTTGGKGFSSGDIFMSGAVGFTSTSEPFGTEELKTTSFRIEPRVGFFVADNIAVGAMVGYQSSKTDDN